MCVDPEHRQKQDRGNSSHEPSTLISQSTQTIEDFSILNRHIVTHVALRDGTPRSEAFTPSGTITQFSSTTLLSSQP